MSQLFFAAGTADWRLGVVASLNSIDQLGQEKMRPLELHFCRNAARFPVMDSLRAALLGVAKEACNFCCAAKLLDQDPVRVRRRSGSGIHNHY
ncbi:hypothetical protein A6456_10715 [Paraburkholderia tropica]|nr:hypothetical protein A6456_10715 [Paraburkholderia tropica]